MQLTGRDAAIIALAIGIFLCFGYAVLGFTVHQEPLPAFADIVPVTGTVERTRIYENDDHGDSFWVRLDGGQSYSYLEGTPRYGAIQRAVTPGASVRVWPWPETGTYSLAQLEVNGDLILTYEQSLRGYHQRAREGRIVGAVSAAIRACLTAVLIILGIRSPRPSANHRLHAPE